MRKFIFVVVAAILLACCAVSVKTMKNSSFDIEKYKKVAVVDFQGNNKEAGNTLAEMFVPHLMETGFDVIERSGMDKLLKEQKVSLSGALDSDTVHKIGKILGVDALVFGNFHYTKKESKSTVVVSRKPRWFVPRRTAAYTKMTSQEILTGITVRVVDVETGKVLLSSTFPEEINGEEIDVCFEDISKSMTEAIKSK